jgi:hypothetical protein
MTKEELIRVKIIPQLNSIADSVWERGDCQNCDRLISITNKLISILNGIDDD